VEAERKQGKGLDVGDLRWKRAHNEEYEKLRGVMVAGISLSNVTRKGEKGKSSS